MQFDDNVYTKFIWSFSFAVSYGTLHWDNESQASFPGLAASEPIFSIDKIHFQFDYKQTSCLYLQMYWISTEVQQKPNINTIRKKVWRFSWNYVFRIVTSNCLPPTMYKKI